MRVTNKNEKKKNHRSTVYINKERHTCVPWKVLIRERLSFTRFVISHISEYVTFRHTKLNAIVTSLSNVNDTKLIKVYTCHS